MDTQATTEAPLSATVNVTPASGNGRVSKEVDGETLCQTIYQARYKATWYDAHRGDWGYRRNVPDGEVVRETNWHLTHDGFAPASEERIIRALRHVEKVEAQWKREKALKAFAEAVGPRYAECTLENYRIDNEAQRKVVDAIQDYAGHVAERVEASVNIILFGPSGSGKDHLAVALARQAILADVHVAWRNGRDLFGAFRAAMDDRDVSEDDILEPLTSAAVLLISDPLPPSGPLTVYQQDILYRVVDGRYRLRKPVWLTLNVHNGQEADERIGVPIVDRLRDGALVLKCDWESYRKPLEQAA